MKQPNTCLLPWILTALLALGTLFFLLRLPGGEQPAFAGQGGSREGETLIIDAGHGGEDGGAVSLTGAAESHINLAIARRLDLLLGLYGQAPVLLREDDRSLHDPQAKTLREKKVSDLHNRAARIEAVEHAVLLSIHQNTYTSPQYRGAQVFYGGGEGSQALAGLLQDLLRETLDPSNDRTPARIPESVYLLNHISCPAVLVECGFLSNPEEDRLLQSEGYQTKLAAVLAAGWLCRSGTAASYN